MVVDKVVELSALTSSFSRYPINVQWFALCDYDYVNGVGWD